MSSKIKYLSTILAPISIGELIDKITILEIKQIYMTGIKLKNINKEMKLLKNILQDKNLEINIDLIKNLKKTNKKLWEIEDGKRAAEKNKKFDEKFIELARNVYKFNDERAKIKLAINTSLGSNIKEVKSYE